MGGNEPQSLMGEQALLFPIYGRPVIGLVGGSFTPTGFRRISMIITIPTTPSWWWRAIPPDDVRKMRPRTLWQVAAREPAARRTPSRRGWRKPVGHHPRRSVPIFNRIIACRSSAGTRDQAEGLEPNRWAATRLPFSSCAGGAKKLATDGAPTMRLCPRRRGNFGRCRPG